MSDEIKVEKSVDGETSNTCGEDTCVLSSEKAGEPKESEVELRTAILQSILTDDECIKKIYSADSDAEIRDVFAKRGMELAPEQLGTVKELFATVYKKAVELKDERVADVAGGVSGSVLSGARTGFGSGAATGALVGAFGGAITGLVKHIAEYSASQGSDRYVDGHYEGGRWVSGRYVRSGARKCKTNFRAACMDIGKKMLEGAGLLGAAGGVLGGGVGACLGGCSGSGGGGAPRGQSR